VCFESTFDSVTSFQAQIPHGKPGGSCGHGHIEVSRVHVGRYSMPGREISQGKIYMKNFSSQKQKDNRIGKLALDLLAIKPIIGRNTLNPT